MPSTPTAESPTLPLPPIPPLIAVPAFWPIVTTTKEQVFDAEKYLGTPKERIVKKLGRAVTSAFSWGPAH